MRPPFIPACTRRRCPDCNSNMHKRSAQTDSAFVLDVLFICTNPTCGATFTGVDQMIVGSRPPAVPRMPYKKTEAVTYNTAKGIQQ